jgi:hypothetical protein
MRRKESTVKKWVHDVLAPHVSAGRCWYIMPASGIYAADGTPDFVGWLCGHPFVVETKRDENETPRPNQVSSIHNATNAGGAAFVVLDRDSLAQFSAWCAARSDPTFRPVAAPIDSRTRLTFGPQRA